MAPLVVSKETATYFAYLAINKLLSKLNKTPEIPNSDIAKAIDYANYNETIKAPLFVTWNILHLNSGERELRGCIGNFGELELPKYVKEYALISALEDSRFPPIDKLEVSEIEKDPKLDLGCSVTVLHSFEDITENPFDWVVGEHGIRLVFKYRNRRYSSTFLPEVALEQGWDCRETMDALIRKAGVSGRVSFADDAVGVLSVERYRGVKGEARLAAFAAAAL